MQATLPRALDDDQLASVLESLLLVAGGPVALQALATAAGVNQSRVRAILTRLQRDRPGGIRIQLHGNQAQLVTAPENVGFVHQFLGTAKPPALSRAALETLTIIAYRQPVTRSEIEQLRGVNSDRAVQTLLARELIEERGQRETIGRPMQYGTSFGFLEYFGLSSLEELPPLPSGGEPCIEAGTIGLRSAASSSAQKDEPHARHN